MTENTDTPRKPWRAEDFPQADLTDQIAVLVAGANALVREGRLEDAEAVYRRILKTAPHNLQAITFVALRAFDAGRYEESIVHLKEALVLDPNRDSLHRNLALVRLAQGLNGKALQAIDRAIELNPDSALNHLHRGVILESLDRKSEALASYGRALARDPVLRHLPSGLPPKIRALAHRAISHLAPILLARIDAAQREVETASGAPLPARARDFLEIFKGLTPRVYEDSNQRPEFLFYPGLNPRPWFERGEFSWIRALESATPAIRTEFEALDAGLEEPHLPAQSACPKHWQHLAGSLAWGSFPLYRSGVPVPKILHVCPGTFSALKCLPLAQGRGHSPEVFFSTLKPGTHLPAHHGQSNAWVTIHLALVVPDESTIQVGGETRHWRKGRTLIFDDSFKHVARNEGSAALTVLTANIWNPALSAIERELIERVIDAHSRFSEEYFT